MVIFDTLILIINVHREIKEQIWIIIIKFGLKGNRGNIRDDSVFGIALFSIL